MESIIKRIEDYSLEDIMGDRFSNYAKSIIQERAIPDVRDGLKPVQRRILYYMYDEKNTYDKSYIKCAYTVGGVLGKFHPHGDSSVYDAMVRMSQWWKQSNILIEIHGNNGSMDGDPAAAYRYTEARLAKISSELTKDLDKNTVTWAPNFDDRFLEPTVLPAKFPNLLVNGGSGISAGYATNIPPHNLGEVIDATIKRIESPNCNLDTLLNIIKGPDFPTGGIVEGKAGIVDAFTTGRGKVVVRAKYHLQKEKGKNLIIIDEIPFEVNKQALVTKMESIRIDKKIDGIAEVRDETDRDGLRIVIELKKDVDSDLIINYLYKNTDLQISYNYNMVAIVNQRPMTLGLIPILDAYIKFQKEVITNRTKFDLEHAKKQYHILEGLIKAISIMDKVISVIRASKNKSDAKDNLVKEFTFTIEQAEAIVMLQLYRLTNTDILEVQNTMADLANKMKIWEQILNNEEALKHVMKTELKLIKKEYATERKTEIRDNITEIKIDTNSLISKENVIVAISNEGYIKKVSQKSYNSLKDEETGLKPGDYLIGLYELNNLDTILMFTNQGNYLYVPVHTIFEAKWKDLGKHVSNLVTMSPEERIIKTIVLDDKNKEVIFFTRNGLTKRTKLEEFIVSRYSKVMNCIKLKEDDEVVSVEITSDNCIFVTNNGYYLNIKCDEVPLVGLRTSGVKGIKLKDDFVVSGNVYNSSNIYMTIFTNKNTAKRVKLSELNIHTRTRLGDLIIKKVKSSPYRVVSSFVVNNKEEFILKDDTDINILKDTDISIMDSLSTGSNINYDFNEVSLKVQLKSYLEKKIEDNKKIIKEDLNNVKELTIDDFIDDFRL